MAKKKFPPARILAIESSCDETAAAVVEDGRRLLSSVVASQADLHAEFGGVYPEVASREHIKAVYSVTDQALTKAHMDLGEVDAIAVTQGPGLPGSLVVGINMAKGLVLGSGKPLIGVNHLEGHLYSAWLDLSNEDDLMPEPEFPLLALIVSGGHTALVLMTGHLEYEYLGGTLDDAAGEAFDKVARLLDLGYPGGPAIQKAAEGGDPNAFKLPRSWLKDTWNFSFSGLKTAVLHTVQGLQKDGQHVPLPVADLAASFQEAVVDVLVTKARFAAQEFKAKQLLVAGGVSANAALRNQILRGAPGRVHIPHISLCTDNAAMIGAAAYYRFVHGHTVDLSMDARPNWPLTEL